MSNKTDTGR